VKGDDDDIHSASSSSVTAMTIKGMLFAGLVTFVAVLLANSGAIIQYWSEPEMHENVVALS